MIASEEERSKIADHWQDLNQRETKGFAKGNSIMSFGTEQVLLSSVDLSKNEIRI